VSGAVLVTGGAGFIGSHVVDELIGAGREVVVLDASATSVHPDATFVRGDVRDPDVVEHAIRGAGAVCHQAAMVGLGVDMRDVADYVSVNDLGTAVLLRTLAARGFRGRIVLASSMVVYGEGRYRCDDHGLVRPPPREPALLRAGIFEPPCPSCGRPLRPEPVPEDAPVDPRSVYAATKLHQEHLCFSYGRECGASVTALRYHNVYGSRMPRDTPYAGVAAIFRSAVEAGLAPEVFEDGMQMRDFVHVEDVARANVLAITRPEPAQGAFNVASGAPRTVLDMACALVASSADAAHVAEPVITGRYRLGDVRHVFASTERAAATLGFRPQISFEEGMRSFATAELRS
jgi:dTDP-L-rhamnose 4-epimerase